MPIAKFIKKINGQITLPLLRVCGWTGTAQGTAREKPAFVQLPTARRFGDGLSVAT